VLACSRTRQRCNRRSLIDDARQGVHGRTRLCLPSSRVSDIACLSNARWNVCVNHDRFEPALPWQRRGGHLARASNVTTVGGIVFSLGNVEVPTEMKIGHVRWIARNVCVQAHIVCVLAACPVRDDRSRCSRQAAIVLSSFARPGSACVRTCHDPDLILTTFRKASRHVAARTHSGLRSLAEEPPRNPARPRLQLE
jgi:hypothetical protein